MPQQQRAARTKATIVRAAAEVFGNIGYEAATISDILRTAGVTKGALYFHFASKKELAQAVLDVQVSSVPAPPEQPLKLQRMLDQGMLVGHLLKHDPLVRGSVRLTVERGGRGAPDRRLPYLRWSQEVWGQLEMARESGELLPHVSTKQTAEMIVGAFAGIQGMSQTFSDYEDVCERASSLYHCIMPSVAVPAVLGRLDMAPDRGARVMASIEVARDRSATAAAIAAATDDTTAGNGTGNGTAPGTGTASTPGADPASGPGSGAAPGSRTPNGLDDAAELARTLA
ncbi:ScbR family autoregulator-binding transcription factor [Streptomyces sp. NPDC054796]